MMQHALAFIEQRLDYVASHGVRLAGTCLGEHGDMP
jgi:hypothetical protein